MKIDMISRTSTGMDGTTIYLEVFNHTSLQPSSMVQLTELDQCFKYNMKGVFLSIMYFDDKGTLQRRDEKFNLRELLQDCAEIQTFAEKYYPEFVV